MTGTDESNIPNEKPGESDNGLYHKQDLARRRLPPDYRPTDGPRKGPARDLSHAALLTNVRIFIIVFGCMLVLLFVAVWVAQKGMQIRNHQSTGRRPLSTLADNPGGTPVNANAADRELADTQKAPLFDGAMLDTSAIRKAVFLTKQGKQLAEGGDLKGAIDLYREALSIWPNLAQAWVDLGQAYLKLGKYDQARLALEKAVEQDPVNVHILNDLGVVHLHQGDLDHAEEYFNAAVEISTDFPEGYYNLALCHLTRKSNDLARAYLDLYIRKRPGDARALKELAYLDALAGEYAAAQKKLDLAIQSSPDWSALYFDAAAAGALQGRIEATFSYLGKALERTSPRITYQVYQQPAFNEMRTTELGKEFEKILAEQARKLINQTNTVGPATNRQVDVRASVPILSGTGGPAAP